MTSRKSYDIIRIPSNDWNVIAETVSLDENYSEEIDNEVWNALENVRFLPDPWVLVQITDGISTKADLLADRKTAEKYTKKIKGNLSSTTQIYCIRARYRNS